MFLALGAVPWGQAAALSGAAAAALAFSTGQAEARSFARSSGGYSRTPSFSSGFSRSRTPSFGSGGYTRSAPRARSGGLGTVSPSDRAISRQEGGAALNQFRARQAPPGGRTPSFGTQGQAGTPFAGTRTPRFGGWTPPAYALNSPRRFGAWDAVMLWFLFSTLSRPGHAAFFYNNANDPGVQAWRAQAEARAATDPALKAQLDKLNQDTAALQGTPRDPGAVPPDATPRSSHGLLGPLLVLFFGCLLLLWLWWRRRTPRRAATARDPTMPASPISSAIGLIRHKLSGERYTPSLFRVGMTITLDPSPFVLAAGHTKVVPPPGAGAGAPGLISVERVGTLQIGGVTLTRLYLPGGGLFQLHLNAAGQPDECRYFSPLDEVNPASADEWGFWLDDAEGAIGMPDFQAKDGKQYWRAWSPGPSRVPPVAIEETIQSLDGETTRRQRAMLYGLPTELAHPAPPTEYIMVSAVEQSGQAFVELLAGIDFNSAALSLA